MTIDEQAQALEASYGKYHRRTSQTWRTEEDRREALNTLKGHLREAERTLRLPETGDTGSARDVRHRRLTTRRPLSRRGHRIAWAA
jgi:hypothetical protein